jgi:GT2 family glycosyltransferase
MAKRGPSRSDKRSKAPSGSHAAFQERHFVSIVIPTINDVRMTDECVRAIARHTRNVEHEVIVVDDGSPEETQKSLGTLSDELEFRLLLSAENTGFSATCNRGIEAATGDFIVLMNNDVVVRERWLSAMLKCANSDPRIGLVGARLLYADGSLQHAGIFFDPRIETAFDHRYRHGSASAYEVLQDADVIGVTFALVLARRELVERIGPMDETLFVSLEDVDYCLRAREAGFRVVYCAKAAATHYEGATRGRAFYEMDPLWLVRQMETLDLFFSKWADSDVASRVPGLQGFDQFCRQWLAAHPSAGR